MSAVKEDEPPPAPSPADSYEPAIKRMRETSRQLLLYFGAIGAIVAAGLQLSSIGKLDNESGRLTLAVIAAAFAFAGLAVALWSNVRVNNSREITLTELLDGRYESEDVRAVEVFSPELLDGYPSLAALITDYRENVVARRVARERKQPNRVALLSMRIDRQEALLGNILHHVRYLRIRRLYARWTLLATLAALTVGGAVALLTWATNPPDRPAAVTPVGSIAIIGDAGTLAGIEREHGAACIVTLKTGGAGIKAVVQRITGDAATVMTIPVAGCPAFLLDLPTDLLIPNSAEGSLPAGTPAPADTPAT